MSALDVDGIVPQQYIFSKPPLNLVCTGNQESYHTFRSATGGQISPLSTEAVSINVNSASEYLDPSQSFLSVTLSVRDATGAIKTGAKISSAGLGALFSNVRLRIADTVVEDIDSYPLHLIETRKNASDSRKHFLTVSEGYMNPDVIGTTGRQTFYHALELGVFRGGSMIPLAHLANGMNVELTLANGKDFFVGDGSLTYTIESITFQGKMIAPNPVYLAKQFAALSQGKSLVIPYVRTRRFISAGTNSQTCNVVSQVGQLQSLAGFVSYFQQEADLADPSKDHVLLSKNPNIKTFSVTAAGITTPTGLPFRVSSDGTDPASVYLQAILAGGVYDCASGGLLSQNAITQAFTIGYSWRSLTESFGAGYSFVNSNGQLELLLEASAPISSATRITTFAFVDTLLVITGGDFATVGIYDRFNGI